MAAKAVFVGVNKYGPREPLWDGALNGSMRAIDDFFRELSPLLARPLLGFQLEDQPTLDELRAHWVPKLEAPGAASY